MTLWSYRISVDEQAYGMSCMTDWLFPVLYQPVIKVRVPVPWHLVPLSNKPKYDMVHGTMLRVPGAGIFRPLLLRKIEYQYSEYLLSIVSFAFVLHHFLTYSSNQSLIRSHSFDITLTLFPPIN